MRGLNKPSTDVIEQQKTIPDQTISSDSQQQQQQTTDENGITFLVDLFKNIF